MGAIGGATQAGHNHSLLRFADLKESQHDTTAASASLGIQYDVVPTPLVVPIPLLELVRMQSSPHRRWSLVLLPLQQLQ